MDSKRKSILKAFSWRFLATFITMITLYFSTGNLSISMGAGAIDAIIKLFVYYFHERLWVKFKNMRIND